MTKFYRTVITLEILSEDTGPSEASLGEIADECDDGAWSGHFLKVEQTEVTPKKMAELLQGQGSDPSFFDLTPDGEELDES